MNFRSSEVPCNNCDKRMLHCHNRCREYIDFTVELRKRRNKNFNQLKINETIYDGGRRRMKYLSTRTTAGTKHKGYTGSGSRR